MDAPQAVGLCFCLNFLVIFSLLPGQIPATTTANSRSFTIDYNNNTFLKDGKPFRYVSGSIHYARVPHQYWRDRLEKMYAGGLNAIQVYVPWNWHEPQPGVYRWDGDHDLIGFLKTAQDVGLVVILRGGPYICGEWDFGGFPGWILKNNGSIVLRTMDPGYINPVNKWLDVMLPKIKPMLYVNGGPVVMVQIENEYGSYFACDHNYLDHLKTTFRQHLGPNVILFTTDGAADNFLKCGTHKDVYATVDFGPSGDIKTYFASQRKYEPKGPLVNSEYYTGWLDYWGGKHAHGDTTAILKTLTEMLDMGANVNMYMYEGGTNFGYTSGADPPFNICPTSYDYDAPLTEAGDITSKYDAIRQLLLQPKYKLHDDVKVPSNTRKGNYGSIKMQPKGSVLDLLSTIGPAHDISSKYPLSMEELGANDGFVLYRTILKRDYSSEILNITCIRDRGYILINGDFQGIVDRQVSTLLTFAGRKGQELNILVENQGHINFGSAINGNRKGLVGNVTIGKDVLTDWLMFPLNFTKMFNTGNVNPVTLSDLRIPHVYMGVLNVSASQMFDTYLNPTGWFKGQAFINGFNLGRYWPVKGPQVTLYVPRPVWNFKSTQQTVMLFELENAPCSATSNNCAITFQNTSYINKNP